MFEGNRDDPNLMRILSIDERQQQQRHPQATFETSPSITTVEIDNTPHTALDVFDDIYSNRAHQWCVDISYFTLLSMTLAVVFWIAYWLAWNRCQNLKDPQSNSSLCDFVTVLEIFTFISLGISPVLFIFSIYLWLHYACYNPLDSIRQKFLELKLEGDQWKQQLDDYYTEHKTRYLSSCRCKQKRELNERGYGYIILSPHGIILDELILFSARKNIIDNAFIFDNEKLLKLTLKKTCSRPWKFNISIYLPENYIDQDYKKNLEQLLKIQINSNAVISPLP